MDLALNTISIRTGIWNLGSTNWKFLGIWIVDRSIGLSRINVDMVGIIRNVNVRGYVLSVELIVAVV